MEASDVGAARVGIMLRDGVRAPAGFGSRLSAAMYPSLRQAGMIGIVPLNMLFVRCSRARRKRLLDQIAARFGPQLAAYSTALDEHGRLLQ